MSDSSKKSKGARKEGADPVNGLGGILGGLAGLANLVEKLGELAERGDQQEDSAKEFRFTRGGKEVSGVYGVHFKVGLNDESGERDVKVEPFGNVHKDKSTGQTVVEEVREPLFDLFEEDDHLLLVVEMPGVSVDDIRLDVHHDVLTLRAERGDKKYYKEILLPGEFEQKKMSVTCNNGVVEILCSR